MGSFRRTPWCVGFGLVLTCVVGACASFPNLSEGNSWPTPTAGAVVSEHPLATDVGLAILDAGGNATDAAIATALALAVVYPQAGNLGGGGFAIVVSHDPDLAPKALDFRETSPLALTPSDFLNEEGVFESGAYLGSPLVVGVPGTAAGLWALHQEGGSLPWAQLVLPAINLAEAGFLVDSHLARDLRAEGSRMRLEADPVSQALFYPGGYPLIEGERLEQPDLARTLGRLSDRGPEGFYEGPVAGALVAYNEANGGRITASDLRDYEVRWLPALTGWFRGREIITMPPPSSGGIVLLQVLAVLDGMSLDADRYATRNAVLEGGGAGLVADPDAAISARALHWWIEAMRAAFADRAEHMGDPDFHNVPTEQLLSSEWIAARRISIGERANPGVAPWVAPPSEGGGETTHLSVLDKFGNAVSLTTTLNTSFGTGIMVPGAGFLLNNELDDFAIQPGVPNAYGLVGNIANAIEPGKRPLSSMTPTVIRDSGEVVTMVIGSPGGPRIITSVLEVILRVLVYGQSLEAAIHAPRVHQQWKPERTDLEPGWASGAIEALEGRGHEIRVRDSKWASVQGIRVKIGGRPIAVSDPRRGGSGAVQDD
ncbi:MAG: gamma-glutamyltransferase family protein [Planctomycetota bacterium]|nr:gamma-glutamyltransferase family protein [Planctomycetota bacterium]MDG2143573.1 gamma-glutamyltransferase family protein [Planctomycetota bacterium]